MPYEGQAVLRKTVCHGGASLYSGAIGGQNNYPVLQLMNLYGLQTRRSCLTGCQSQLQQALELLEQDGKIDLGWSFSEGNAPVGQPSRIRTESLKRMRWRKPCSLYTSRLIKNLNQFAKEMHGCKLITTISSSIRTENCSPLQAAGLRPYHLIQDVDLVETAAVIHKALQD